MVNRRVSDGIELDMGEDEKVIGIENLDAPKRVALERLLPIRYKVSRKAF
jgi:uncharacterized protein YuzE